MYSRYMLAGKSSLEMNFAWMRIKFPSLECQIIHIFFKTSIQAGGPVHSEQQPDADISFLLV